MSLSFNVPDANIPQTAAAVAVTGFILSVGDGKGVTIPENQRIVKIAEKKIGKGKGKTVAFCLIPKINTPFSEQENEALAPLMVELCEELQKDILTRIQRDGCKAVTPNDISIDACVSEWTNRTFSAETVGVWFDSELSEYLALLIATAKGWNCEAESTDYFGKHVAQAKLIEEKCAAYRAAFVETASKFPSLDPVQCAELRRVIGLCELSGPIVSRILDKITPKTTASALGF